MRVEHGHHARGHCDGALRVEHTEIISSQSQKKQAAGNCHGVERARMLREATSGSNGHRSTHPLKITHEARGLVREKIGREIRMDVCSRNRGKGDKMDERDKRNRLDAKEMRN